jgi:Notch-like protein
MFNTRMIMLVVSILACLIAQTTCNVQYPNIDEDTGCPVNVAHVCNTCAEDQNRLGCYCETDDGDAIVTATVFTPCPADIKDPCANNSCLNGATCVREGLTSYKCTCAPGFGGTICNETLPKCGDANIHCLNAECVETDNIALPVYCQCYDGTRRDPRQNDTCPLSPCYERETETPVCKNNGTCRIINNAHLCECTGGWAGQNCTKALKRPLCQDQPSVCGSGKCQQSLTPPFYSCNCGNHPSTFGKTIDELTKCEQSACYATNPCQNGGTCSNKGKGAFICQCPSRFTGSKCEKNSACFTNPCVNNGICEAFNETTYFCNCPAYFTGRRCEVPVPDPCRGKICGPYGTCQDIRGSGICLCSDGFHHDGTPCQDPCLNKTCGTGVCTRKSNATYEAICSCPVDRKGDSCELPRDLCREAPRCGGGYCKPNYASARGYSCVCEGGVVKNEPCAFSTTCPIKTCGTQGICVETDGLIPTPGSKPIYYVCLCKNGYIASGNCDVLLATKVPAAISRCGGPNGRPYPSRNPNNPIGCFCKNGTHIPEIEEDGPTEYCV